MKIEKGIEMPAQESSRCRVPGFSYYPFNDMEVGDSVFFEGQKSNGKAASSAKKTAARKGKKFIIRTVDGGIRIWRSV